MQKLIEFLTFSSSKQFLKNQNQNFRGIEGALSVLIESLQ
jgi:hypothetical protein